MQRVAFSLIDDGSGWFIGENLTVNTYPMAWTSFPIAFFAVVTCEQKKRIEEDILKLLSIAIRLHKLRIIIYSP